MRYANTNNFETPILTGITALITTTNTNRAPSTINKTREIGVIKKFKEPNNHLITLIAIFFAICAYGSPTPSDINKNFELNNLIIKYSSERYELIDDTSIISSTELISYITIDFNNNEITFDSQTKKNDWHSWEFVFTESINLSDAIGFKLHGTIAQMVWINSDNIEIEMNSGLRTKFYGIKEIESSINNSSKSNTKSNDDFEYSDHWRKEAFKASKEFMISKIPQQMPECKVTSQGLYQPKLVKYIGNKGYRIKLYCEFDCDNNYNNPSYFWIDAYYIGNDKWNLSLIDQKFVD